MTMQRDAARALKLANAGEVRLSYRGADWTAAAFPSEAQAQATAQRTGAGTLAELAEAVARAKGQALASGRGKTAEEALAALLAKITAGRQ